MPGDEAMWSYDSYACEESVPVKVSSLYVLITSTILEYGVQMS